MSEVRLEQVVKRFGETVALDRVDLRVEQGEFFALLGGSGCGKTTTLRLVAGFDDPNEGAIYFADRRMNGVAAEKRNTAMVFQNYALFPHLDVYGNVAFGLKARHVPGAEIPRRVAEALRLVELEGFEKRKPHTLSGGQQQRVAVARAAVVEPEILLLDEPLSNLDARLRKSTRAALKRIQRALGATTLYVTHDQEEALALADRVAVMRAGRIEQIGTPREIYERPATPFVARFIGETNLLPGVWRREADGRWAVHLEGGKRLIPAQDQIDAFGKHSSIADGAPVLAGVKPEALRLAAEPECLIAGEAQTVEYGGSFIAVACVWPGGTIQARLPADGPAKDIRAGARAAFAFDPGGAVLFPPENPSRS